MKKYVIICAWGIASSLGAWAQKISFEKTTVNAGTTLWKKPVTAVFKYTNREKEPLVIREVDAGCGCLAPRWTQDPLLKGDEGEISITYDAQILGHFDRYIDVYTNTSDKPVRIRQGRIFGPE